MESTACSCSTISRQLLITVTTIIIIIFEWNGEERGDEGEHGNRMEMADIIKENKEKENTRQRTEMFHKGELRGKDKENEKKERNRFEQQNQRKNQCDIFICPDVTQLIFGGCQLVHFWNVVGAQATKYQRSSSQSLFSNSLTSKNLKAAVATVGTTHRGGEECVVTHSDNDSAL